MQRRLPSSFVEAWDGHFETAVAQSRKALGSHWHEAYASSPVWCFVLPAGVCGDSAWAGIMGPGSDRVGRCFPMVIAAAIASDVATAAQTLLDGGGWFDAAARAHQAAQSDATVTVDEFDGQVAALAGPLDALQPHPLAYLRGVNWREARHWRLPLPVRAAAASFLADLWTRIAAASGQCCLWWTDGAGRVPASVLVTHGLPHATAYAGYLDADHVADWQSLGGLAGVVTPMPSISLAVSAATEPVATWLPDDPELFCDLPVTADAPVAAPLAPVAVAPLEAPEPAAAVVVLDRADAALNLVAAEAGTYESRQQAVAAVAAIVRDMPAAELVPGLQSLRMRVMALSPQLRQTSEDLIDPVLEDCAVIAAHVGRRQADLLRIGAATAWHWRSGSLQPFFATGDASVADPVSPGDIDDLLFDTVPLAALGLGASAQPTCGEVSCAVEPGDRLLLMATQQLLQLPPEILARSMALPSCDDARSRIAAAAGLGDDPARWPLAIIEVDA